MTVSMSPDRFEELVGDGLDLIPTALTSAIDNVVILVEPRNDEDPHLLGLYEGIALTGSELADLSRSALVLISHDRRFLGNLARATVWRTRRGS